MPFCELRAADAVGAETLGGLPAGRQGFNPQNPLDGVYPPLADSKKVRISSRQHRQVVTFSDFGRCCLAAKRGLALLSIMRNKFLFLEFLINNQL
ncbi:hypothetical protein J7J13_04405 [bacterium]|nr:hypothetical protein [bacterium]